METILVITLLGSATSMSYFAGEMVKGFIEKPAKGEFLMACLYFVVAIATIFIANQISQI